MFSTLKIKLISMALLAVGVIGFLFWGVGVLHDRAELKEWQTTVLHSVQTASANPKLVVKDVPAQIDVLGKSLLNFKNQIVVQNKAVDDLATKRNEALAARDREAALRKEVIIQSQSLAQQLRNEALTPVDRTKLETELRRVQDTAWEAGL